jgi:RluA family pseudouridine synthase
LNKVQTIHPASPVRIIEPYPFTYRFQVKPNEEGIPLIEVLVQRFSYRSLQTWWERIEQGDVLLDNQAIEPEVRLRANQQISISHPRVIEPSVPDGVRIHVEHSDYLLVEKPAPMPVHSGGRYHKNTLLSILEQMGYSDLKTVHRLDAVTSGLILLARNTSFARAATRAFASSGVQKTYYALVMGSPLDDTFTVDRPIFRKKGFVFDSGWVDGALEAQTLFEVVHRYEKASLVRCKPVTGRTHQIRLHLRDVGCPIAGDLVYQSHQESRIQNRPIALFNAGLRLPDVDLDLQIAYPQEWNTPEGFHSYL